jgi:hypothetical protein
MYLGGSGKIHAREAWERGDGRSSLSERVRTCGDCTLCCKVMGVSALEKPGGVWCDHRTRDGCGIYADRPHACRAFECVWLMDPEMPRKFRPDLTKVVLDQDAAGRRLIARCDPANPRAWRREPIYGALKGYAADHWAAGKIVIAVAGRQAWLVAPQQDIDLGEVGPDARLTVRESADSVQVDA